MLPPTVMADPISATTWPKAVVITAARANRASRATVHAVRQRPAPSVSAVGGILKSTPWTAAAASAAAIGSASKTSPTTIACQVYSHSSPPSGPRRDSTPYSSRPTTTVGNARAVFTTVRAARRPQKGRVASTKPTGMPTPQASTVAMRPILRVRSAMPYTSASPENSNATARRNPSPRKSIPRRSSPGMGSPLGERRIQGQHAAAVAGGRLLVGDGVVELPEHQAEVAAQGEAPGGIPPHAGVGRQHELGAELVPARVAWRRAADRHPPGPAHIRCEPAPCLAAGQDELQPGICQDDVVGEWAGLTLRGQGILRWIHDVAVRSPVGEAERCADRAERGLVADAAGLPAREPHAYAAAATPEVPEREDPGRAATHVAVRRMTGVVTDLGAHSVHRCHETEPHECNDSHLNPSPSSLCRSFPAAVGYRAVGAPWGRHRAARRRGAAARVPRRPPAGTAPGSWCAPCAGRPSWGRSSARSCHGRP